MTNPIVDIVKEKGNREMWLNRLHLRKKAVSKKLNDLGEELNEIEQLISDINQVCCKPNVLLFKNNKVNS